MSHLSHRMGNLLTSCAYAPETGLLVTVPVLAERLGADRQLVLLLHAGRFGARLDVGPRKRMETLVEAGRHDVQGLTPGGGAQT